MTDATIQKDLDKIAENTQKIEELHENVVEAYDRLLAGRDARIKKLESSYSLVADLVNNPKIAELAEKAGMSPQEWLSSLVGREITSDFILVPVATFIGEKIQELATARGITVEALMTHTNVSRSLAVLFEDQRL